MRTSARSQPRRRPTMSPLYCVFVLTSLICGYAPSLLAQHTPQAVLSDPQPDKNLPPSIVGLTVPSHGIEMDATLYLAGGPGLHGVVLLLHGLPGYELNGDLAQSIRRAGWNVLMFHYRGTWGTAGKFSQSAAIEDVAEAVRFLRDPAQAAKYRNDPRQIVVIGHSLGGFLAGYDAGHDKKIRAVAMISAVNLGKVNSDPGQREIRLRRWQAQLHPVRGASAAELFAEAEQHVKDWDYVQWSEALRQLPVLLVEADDQNLADMEALGVALQQKNSALTRVAIHSDHSFSDSRIALQETVVKWLEGLRKR